MKNNYSFLEIVTLAAFTLMSFGARLEAQIYEYDWVGGKPGFSGKLFLDAPSSASAPNGGTIADVLAGSYLTTPLGNYSIFDSVFSYNVAPWTPDVVWNQNNITGMVLFFKAETPSNYQLGTEAVAQVGYFEVANAVDTAYIHADGSWSVLNGANDDNTGQWLASPVPEPATFALLTLGVAAFLVFPPGAKLGQTLLSFRFEVRQMS